MDNFSSQGVNAFAVSAIPMWLYDPETLRFLEVNNAAIRQYGYDKNEFLGMTLNDIRPQEDIKAITDNINRNVKMELSKPQAGRWRHRNSKGEIFYVEIFASYIDYNNKPARLVQAVNIDEKIKDEKELEAISSLFKDDKDDFQFILSSIGEVVWLANADDLQLIYTNDACEKVYGYTAREMIADRALFLNSIHPEDLACFVESFKAMLKNGRVENEFRVFHKDGSIHYLKGNAVFKKGENGMRDMCSGITVDITELKLAEQQRSKYLKKIKTQNAQLKEIAHMQSHQVRGPVATILGLQQLLNTENPSDPINLDVLAGIKDSILNLDNIIRNVDSKTRCI